MLQSTTRKPNIQASIRVGKITFLAFLIENGTKIPFTIQIPGKNTSPMITRGARRSYGVLLHLSIGFFLKTKKRITWKPQSP